MAEQDDRKSLGLITLLKFKKNPRVVYFQTFFCAVNNKCSSGLSIVRCSVTCN